MSQQIAVIGTQWGDEGKGKIVDYITQSSDIVARFAGGSNAGHTIVVDDTKYVFHLLPSGILWSKKICVIGNGVVVNLEILLRELNELASLKIKPAKVLLSEKCHVILPKHISEDKKKGGKIGTTAQGIGPVYTDAVARTGLRIMDLQASTSKALAKQRSFLQEILKEHRVEVGDCSQFLDTAQQKKQSILFEGAQATLLDIYHGTYPYVTSSHPTIGGIFTGTGFRPRNMKVIGVVKAYTTRVGKGPFPTELNNALGEKIREVGSEFGATTGRPRRCGWLDITMLRYAKIINGLDELAVTKLDILDGFDEIKVCTHYTINGKKVDVFTTNLAELEKAKPVYTTLAGWKSDTSKLTKFSELPKKAKEYLQFIEKTTDVPISMVGIGPGRKQILMRD